MLYPGHRKLQAFSEQVEESRRTRAYCVTQVLDDLEDYFERLDARRAELEAGVRNSEDAQRATTAAFSILVALLSLHLGDMRSAHEWLEESGSLPSVERFNDVDFRQLVRCRSDDGTECAICLANLLPDEARGSAIQTVCVASGVASAS